MAVQRITNAMKLVSAAKLRKAKSAFESSRLYLGRLLESIQETLDDVEDVPAALFGREAETLRTSAMF